MELLNLLVAYALGLMMLFGAFAGWTLVAFIVISEFVMPRLRSIGSRKGEPARRLPTGA